VKIDGPLLLKSIKNVQFNNRRDLEMSTIIEELEKEQLNANAPEFHTGDTVKVYGKIKEGNRERVQVF
jgi:ribosomal protein L19